MQDRGQFVGRLGETGYDLFGGELQDPLNRRVLMQRDGYIGRPAGGLHTDDQRPGLGLDRIDGIGRLAVLQAQSRAEAG